jgi:hypothetical protein
VDIQPNIKKLVLSVIGLMLLLVLVPWLWHYSHTGKIIITTNNPYRTISLVAFDDKTGRGSTSSKTFKANGRLSVSLSSGKYFVSVEGSSQATTRVIRLKPRQTLRYEIDPVVTSGVEPVIYQSARNVVASASELLYTNAASGYLYKIDAQNNISVLDSTIAFQTIQWADPSYGVGQNASGRLYTIVNGSVSPLDVPFSYGGGTVSFDVSSNRQVYVSYGGAVYSRNPNGTFKKIYAVDTSNLVLAAGVNKVAFVGETEEEEKNNSPPLFTAVSSAGKVIKNQGDGEVRRLIWSPDGHYLASVNEASVDIYDASLRKVTQLPSSNSIGEVTWLDNNNLLYGSKDELWSYDLSNQKSELLANMPLGNYITSLTTSSDKAYIYLTTTDFGSNYVIRRIGLHGQQVPRVVYQLQDILPLVLNDCSLGLVNFAQPTTILVKSFPDSNLSTSAYLQEAQDRLNQNGFDLNKFQFKVVPGN